MITVKVFRYNKIPNLVFSWYLHFINRWNALQCLLYSAWVTGKLPFLRHWLTNEYEPWWETWQLSNKWLHYQYLIFREHASLWQRCGIYISVIFFVTISKKPGPKNGKKKTMKKNRIYQFMLTVYHYKFPKLTKEFACKQQWCWFGDEETSSSEQCVKKFSFQKP